MGFQTQDQWTCDQCGRVEVKSFMAGTGLPDYWKEVIVAPGSAGGEDDVYFCSWECVELFAAKRRRGEA